MGVSQKHRVLDSEIGSSCRLVLGALSEHLGRVEAVRIETGIYEASTVCEALCEC